MYMMDELFDSRDVFAAKIREYMEDNAYTKAQLCKEAGISRPTLDKLLAGEITSKSHFLRHCEKILNAIRMTPDAIMGNVEYPFSRYNTLKRRLRIDDEAISETMGIDMSVLRKIEAGEEVSVRDLRDVALCCRTGTRGVLGSGYFNPTLSTICSYVDDEMSNGFWGHIGVLLSSQSEYRWYPITQKTMEQVYDRMVQEYMIIPCMNNKLILLNMAHVDNVVLLDDEYEAPSYANGDVNEGGGGIPLVIYESLQDWVLQEERPNDKEDLRMSDLLRECIQEIVNEKKWDESSIYWETEGVEIIYKSGNKLKTIAEFKEPNTIGDVVREIYESMGFELEQNRLQFNGKDETTIICNLNNIAMAEMPLVAVENAICEEMEEIMREMLE